MNTERKGILFIKAFISDFIVFTMSLLVAMAIITVISITVSGSREGGMSFGLISGFALALGNFYYLRGQFDLSWSILQMTINGIISAGAFSIISYLLRDADLEEKSYGYILIIFSLPIFVSLNKPLLDLLTIKLNGQKREKKPFHVL